MYKTKIVNTLKENNFYGKIRDRFIYIVIFSTSDLISYLDFIFDFLSLIFSRSGFAFLVILTLFPSNISFFISLFLFWAGDLVV